MKERIEKDETVYVCNACFTTTCVLRVKQTEPDGHPPVAPNSCPYPNCGPGMWKEQ